MVAWPEPDRGRERACAWFADERDGVLYFGISSFWSALWANHGNAVADLVVSEARRVGRFDLSRELALPVLPVGAPDAPSGVWDVLTHPNGRLYFTTYFDSFGSIDPVSGSWETYPAAGLGLNELALGPAGKILATRYGYGPAARGALVVLAPDGSIEAEHALEAGSLRAAGKSLAFDPLRKEAWVNTDLFASSGSVAGRDVRVLAWDGREQARWSEPEVQFMAFAADGTGYFAERAGDALQLRLRAPGDPGNPRVAGRVVQLDPDFAKTTDFAQELRIGVGGVAVVTRWSGRVHLVGRDGRVRTLELPRSGGRGLYYSAFLHGDRVCATRCDGIEVVCASVPE